MATPHYVLIGTFTQDLLPDGGYTLGGTVFYSGIQARRLGWDVSIISTAKPDIDLRGLEAGITPYIQESPENTIFQNLYDSQGNRVQYLKSKAVPIRPDALDKLERPPDILHLGPLTDEVDAALADYFPQARLGITPQGWMRRIGEEGRVYSQRWADAKRLLPKAWAVVLSEEDVNYDESEIERLAGLCRVLVCTRNRSAASLFVEGQRRDIPARPSEIVDPTGAGDIFAAAFFIHYHETDDPQKAVRFAHIAAGLSIEGAGVSRVMGRDAITRILTDLPPI